MRSSECPPVILWSSVSLSDLYCSATAGVEGWSLRCRDEVYKKIKMVRQNARLTWLIHIGRAHLIYPWWRRTESDISHFQQPLHFSFHFSPPMEEPLAIRRLCRVGSARVDPGCVDPGRVPANQAPRRVRVMDDDSAAIRHPQPGVPCAVSGRIVMNPAGCQEHPQEYSPGDSFDHAVILLAPCVIIAMQLETEQESGCDDVEVAIHASASGEGLEIVVQEHVSDIADEFCL